MQVIVIGGGVAGLSAGIYCRLSGLDCLILEQQNTAGGNLTGWYVQDCYIDNCIRRLYGTKPQTPMYQMWKELGILGGDVQIDQPDYFYASEDATRRIVFWRDPERARREMLQMSPRDEREIQLFFQAVQAVRGQAPRSCLLRYVGINLNRLAARFRDPLLEAAMTDYMDGDFAAYTLLKEYGAFCDGNGGLPLGGSSAAAQRMVQRFTALGGQLLCQKQVVQVDAACHHANGVRISDGTYISADAVLCACDPQITFQHLLPQQQMPLGLTMMYRKTNRYPIYSSIHAAFVCDRVPELTAGANVFPVAPFFSDGYSQTRMAVQVSDPAQKAAPAGKAVLQAMIFQHEPACRSWLAMDEQAYLGRKQELALQMFDRIAAHYPTAAPSLKLLDSWTPASYYRRLGCYLGAYLPFAPTRRPFSPPVSIQVPGLDNVYLSGQWLASPGGLANAARSGYRTVKRLIKSQNRQIGHENFLPDTK